MPKPRRCWATICGSAVRKGPAEALNATECTQPAMLTAGVATYRLWRERGGAVPEHHGRTQSRRVQRAGRRRLSRFQDRGRSGEVSRRGHAGRGAAGAGRHGRDPRARRHRRRSGLRRGRAGRGGRGGQFQCARPGGDRRHGSRASRAPSKSPSAKGARRAMPLPISVPAHSSLMRPAARTAARAAAATSRCSRAGDRGLRRRRENARRTGRDPRRLWSNSCIRRSIGPPRCAP